MRNAKPIRLPDVRNGNVTIKTASELASMRGGWRHRRCCP